LHRRATVPGAVICTPAIRNVLDSRFRERFIMPLTDGGATESISRLSLVVLEATLAGEMKTDLESLFVRRRPRSAEAAVVVNRVVVAVHANPGDIALSTRQACWLA